MGLGGSELEEDGGEGGGGSDTGEGVGGRVEGGGRGEEGTKGQGTRFMT
jgi:hypothetical protein